MTNESPFTLCARAGHDRDSGAGDPPPTSMPIVQSSAFEIDTLESLDAIGRGARRAHTYSRVSNPTVAALEKDVARLEKAERALAFGSGMAAINAVLAAHLAQGDHVICAEHIYGVTYFALTDLFARFGVHATFVDTQDERAVAAAFTDRTRLVIAETVSNPILHVADVAMLARLAHARGAKLVVDNTFATPILARPIEHGADLVVHSATKYLGGHSDVVAGIACGSGAAMRAVFKQAIVLGAALDPFAAWLVLRGLKTLALRMERQCSNAAALADRLAAHPRVSRVWYPRGAIAGHGGAIVTATVRGDVASFVKKLVHVPIVTSLGGTMTTLNHPALTSHRSLPAAERARLGITDDMLRFSVGIEDIADVWADVEQALG